MVYVGIDLGASKTAISIAGACPDMNERVKTAHCKDFSQNARDIFGLIDSMLQKAGLSRKDIASVGLCSPGPLDLKNGRIIKVATAGWENIPIKKIFADELDVPFSLQNDAAGAAYAEFKLGAGKGCKNMLYLTISTGIGGGIIIDGKIYGGLNGCAGEFGHITVNPNGLRCECGSTGCLELYSSGTAIARTATERISVGEQSTLLTYSEITAREVEEAYRAGDPLAISVFDGAMEILGGATANLFQAFAPDAIVFGGGVSNAFDIMRDTILDSARRYMFAELRGALDIRKAGLGSMAGAAGAVLLAKERYLQAVNLNQEDK